MDINKINSASFQSKISIVSPKVYDAVINTMKRNPTYQNIFRWSLSSSANYPKHFNPYRKKCSLVSTEKIRSCTAGFFINSSNKIATIAFHLYDSKENIEKFRFLEPFIKGDNGLLVGARRQYKDSFPLFDKSLKCANRNNTPVSILKGFKDMWEANIAYDSSGDEFFITIKDIQKIYNQTK